MGNFDVCFSWLMQDEDATNLHATVRDNCPSGCTGPCWAISGINSGAWPVQFAKINALPQDQRGVEVKNFYQTQFWNQYFAQIASDEVAKRVFDMSVNGGEGTEIKLLQKAVNSFHVGNPLTVDGSLGPATVAAVNAVNPLTLVAAFQQAQEDHYRAVVAANPAKAKYLAVWLARARR
jgi:lysozyme family protein